MSDTDLEIEDDDGPRREFVTVADGVVLNVLIGGDGPPLVLLHGFPESHIMWRHVAPALAEEFTVICPDLRGYGDSSKPPGGGDHATYSKRAMAADILALMDALGHDTFMLAGHDRGGRVSHRLALDAPERLEKLAVLDIVPTATVFAETTAKLATAYYHWFFLIQPNGLPERLIGSDPGFYLRQKLGRWGSDLETFPEEVLEEYIRCFSDPAAIHAMCEDYRAAASIDLEHDRADAEARIQCPLLVLWGKNGVVEANHDVLACWRAKAVDVRGFALPCGHFLPEEQPDATAAALLDFFTS
ncbi:MAG: alpha/beta hydrolase [Rhodospirillaceae bacterium]|nr:alpha/beta hydrolase [Rhodospirillaceae bacterium]